MRKKYIAGNWKMNLDRRSAIELVRELHARLARRTDVDVAVFPSFVYLPDVIQQLASSPVQVGAQNCAADAAGAFTGEVSAPMLVDCGARSVILGHSERRHVFGETDEMVARKVKIALETGLDVIVCVGETLEERRAKATEKVVGAQLRAALAPVGPREISKVTVAYEPVWAIGTGQNATPEQVGEVHSYLRGVISGLFSDSVADSVRIQYGGSVKPSNVRELLAVPGVDGCLVGGASIKAETFLPLFDFGAS